MMGRMTDRWKKVDDRQMIDGKKMIFPLLFSQIGIIRAKEQVCFHFCT